MYSTLLAPPDGKPPGYFAMPAEAGWSDLFDLVRIAWAFTPARRPLVNQRRLNGVNLRVAVPAFGHFSVSMDVFYPVASARTLTSGLFLQSPLTWTIDLQRCNYRSVGMMLFLVLDIANHCGQVFLTKG
jgi:hypothetical protein